MSDVVIQHMQSFWPDGSHGNDDFRWEEILDYDTKNEMVLLRWEGGIVQATQAGNINKFYLKDWQRKQKKKVAFVDLDTQQMVGCLQRLTTKITTRIEKTQSILDTCHASELRKETKREHDNPGNQEKAYWQNNRKEKAKWSICPLAPPLVPISAYSPFGRTINHSITCAKAAIVSEVIEAKSSFQGRLVELAWQSRFYQVLKELGNLGFDTVNFYKDQSSFFTDSRISDFFLVNKNTSTRFRPFYEIVGELKNHGENNQAMFENIIHYLNERWKHLVKREQSTLEPVGLVIINEELCFQTHETIRFRNGGRNLFYQKKFPQSIVTFFPTPYLIWNTNVEGASRGVTSMINAFTSFSEANLDASVKRMISTYFEQLYWQLKDRETTMHKDVYDLRPYFGTF